MMAVIEGMEYRRRYADVKTPLIVLRDVVRHVVKEMRKIQVYLKFLSGYDSDGWLIYVWAVILCANIIRVLLIVKGEIFKDLIELYPFLSVSMMNKIYWGILALGITFFALVKGKKNTITEVAISCIPVITFYALKSAALLRPLCVCMVAIMFFYAFVIFVQIIRVWRYRKRKFKWFRLGLKKVCLLGQNILIFMSIICFFIPSGWMTSYRNTIPKSGVVIGNENLWGNNTDILKKLSPEIFYNSSLQEQAKALQGLADIEAVYLGVNFVDVEVRNLREQTGGFYNPVEKIIVINSVYMDDISELINITLHEMWHVYEHAMVEKLEDLEAMQGFLFYREVSRWKEELANYQSADEAGFQEYYTQTVEKSAREYANEWTPVYIEYIRNLE